MKARCEDGNWWRMHMAGLLRQWLLWRQAWRSEKLPLHIGMHPSPLSVPAVPVPAGAHGGIEPQNNRTPHLILIACQALANHFSLVSGPFLDRLVLVVLCHTRLSLLVHQQHKLNRHPAEWVCVRTRVCVFVCGTGGIPDVLNCCRRCRGWVSSLPVLAAPHR